MSRPVPDRGEIQHGIVINAETLKLANRLRTIAVKFAELVEGDPEETTAWKTFPSPDKVDILVAELKDEGKILRRQLKLIDDYESTFGEKKGAPDESDEELKDAA